jgi:hypothetical protein
MSSAATSSFDATGASPFYAFGIQGPFETLSDYISFREEDAKGKFVFNVFFPCRVLISFFLFS